MEEKEADHFPGGRRNRYFSVHYFFTGRTTEDSGFDRRIGYAVCRLILQSQI